MNKVFCISAGLLKSKKENSSFSKKHRYLNYGLLKIASILGLYKYSPIVIHGLFDIPLQTFNTCKRLGIKDTNAPVLLSIPSFFALEWAKDFAIYIKSEFPDIKIIVGGRWVVGNNAEWLKRYLNVDVVVPGLVGLELLGLVSSNSRNGIEQVIPVISWVRDEELRINYNHLYDRELFQPSIEVSNGCGMGCSFCEEKDIPLSKLKSALVVADEMEALRTDDGLVVASPYLESSMFVATEKWATDLINERVSRGLKVNWRVETRVDKLKVKNIPALAKAGLKVIDLGLESASHLQLERMKKTICAKTYLEAASNLIKIAADNGIWVKVNVLLYAGETYSSIEETNSWLYKISKYVKGVSVGPVIVYGINGEATNFIDEIKTYGASTVESGLIGVNYLNLSKEIDYETSIEISKNISREYMTAKDFFDLKSFSYFSRDYKYKEFLSDISSINQSDVSFKI